MVSEHRRNENMSLLLTKGHFEIYVEILVMQLVSDLISTERFEEMQPGALQVVCHSG